MIKVEGDLTITGDGTITGGCNNAHGGGVYVAEGGTFTMESGTISKNTTARVVPPATAVAAACMWPKAARLP